MNKQELLDLFTAKFKEQLGLELSDVVSLENDKFCLKMEMMALSIGSLKLDLTDDEHDQMSEFLTMVKDENDPMDKYKNMQQV
jgi:hypothetical protein